MRSSIILGAVALTLLAFILFFEKGSISSGELERRQGRILERFIRDRVERIEIQRKGVTAVLARKPDPENDLDLGLWRLEGPFEAAADQDAVEILMGELEWMDSRRELSDLQPGDHKRFGLDTPRYRVRFTVGREQVLLLVGNLSPKGDGAYVQVVDKPDAVYVVGKDLEEALDHEPGHYHTKELHEGVNIYSSRSVILRDETGSRRVHKQVERWYLDEPQRRLASSPALDEVFKALDRLQATRFVARPGAKLSDYGLDAPLLEVVVERGKYDDKTKKTLDETFSVRFRIGRPCEGHDNESYLTMGAGGPILCALDADLQKARKTSEALLEMRLLPLDDHQVASVKVESGQDRLELTDNDKAAEQGDWSYTLFRGGKQDAAGAANTAALTTWLGLLRGLQVQSWEQVAAAERGLDQPTTTLTFERNGDRPAYVIKLGAGSAAESYLLRGEENAVAVLEPLVEEIVRPIAARFRPPQLLDRAQAELVSIEITQAGPVRRVHRGAAGDFMLESPAGMAADRIVMGELARRLSKLDVVRFVADGAEPEHGLSAPQLQLQLEFKGKQGTTERHTLKVGAATDSGRYAVLDDDPAVFVLAEQLLALLRAPLLDRTLPAVPLERIAALRLQLGKAHYDVRREGDSLVPSVGAAETAMSLARAVASLRAQNVRAQPAPPLSEALATLHIEQGDGNAQPRQLTLWKRSAAGDETPRHLLAMDGVDALFELDDASAAALIAPLAAPAAPPASGHTP